MGAAVKYFYGTEEQILALTPESDAWVERAFYYPSDKNYFYQAVGTLMKKYGDTNPVPNIVAKLGMGIEVHAPDPSSHSIGDVYVASDSFKILKVDESYEWDEAYLQRGQFVTDVSSSTELPPLFQYFEDMLMPIANHKVTPPEGLPGLPE